MSATFTTKLGMRKPDPTPVTGDLVDAQADLNNNLDKIDAAIGIAVCTSTTRPSSPFVGQQAYETDTIASITCISIGPPAWRYTSVPKVASAAARNALMTPYATMRVFRQDMGVEQWYDGTNWLSMGGGGCRHTNVSTTQNFLTGQLNKFSYPTTVNSTPGITPSGLGNTDFTVQTGWDGWWTIDAGGRLGNTSVGAYFAIRKGTTEIKGHNPQGSQTFHVASVSVLYYLVAGDAINFVCGPTANITTAPAGEVQSFAMKYHGQ